MKDEFTGSELREDPNAEYSNGWWYPRFLVDLYTTRQINGEEFIFLGKINSYKRCTANNRWLSRWWGKTPNWVSRTLQKLQHLKLITIIPADPVNNKPRILRTCFKGDEGWLQKEHAFQKAPGPVPKSTRSCSKKHQRSKYSKKVLISSNAATRPGMAGRASNSSFELEEPRASAIPKYSYVLRKWVKFSIAHKFHLLPGNRATRGAKLNGGWSRQQLDRWQKDYRILLEYVDGDKERIKSALRWWMDHYGQEYVPLCKTFTAFCEKFDVLERAIKISIAKVRKENGEDPNQEYDEITEEEKAAARAYARNITKGHHFEDDDEG